MCPINVIMYTGCFGRHIILRCYSDILEVIITLRPYPRRKAFCIIKGSLGWL